MEQFWIKDENGEHDYGSKEDSMIESMFTDPDLFCELYGRKDKYGGTSKGLYASLFRALCHIAHDCMMYYHLAYCTMLHVSSQSGCGSS